MASSSSRPTSVRDWNIEWPSKDVRLLIRIPTNPTGLCGCSLCGGHRIVSGRTFRLHMMELYGSRPSPVKRARPLPPTPPPHHVPPLPTHTEVEQDEPMDFEFDSSHAAAYEGGNDSGDEVDDPGEVSVGQEDVEDKEVWPLEGEGVLSTMEMATLMEYADDPSIDDIPPIDPVSPQPSRSTSPASPRTNSVGPFISVIAPPNDLLDRWPYKIPTSMREPEYSGARLNPHIVPQEVASHSVLHRLLPVLAHVLGGVFNVARRPVELVLRASSAIIRYAEKAQYARFREWYLANHPNADAHLLEGLDLLDPAFEPAAAPATLPAALRRIQVETDLLVHPVCSNTECHHVFLDIDNRDQFSSVPELCPDCLAPTRNKDKAISVLHFPRRSLKSELEVVLRVPGVEHAIEQRAERKRERDLEDAEGGVKPWGKVYRQQDDGSAWREGDLGEGRGGLPITVNLSVDWAQMSSRRQAAADSFGPITLQIADLPAQLRASFSCSMLLGITPGPKQPKAKNLYKYLVPLVMELRDSEMNGLWVRTPGYPQGRLVFVRLGCICCDRPAACEVTGAPNFKANASPCLRCMVTSDTITDLPSYPFPRRDSSAHTIAQLEQMDSVARLVEEDRLLHAQEQADIEAATGRKPRRYPNYRYDNVLKKASVVTGHISALTLLPPGYDKFGMTIFDPMHSLLEGALKTYLHKVLVLGSHGTDQTEVGAATEAAVEGAQSQAAGGAEDEGGDEDAGMDTGVETGEETDYASETDANQAQDLANKVLDQINRGEPVTTTPAEIAVLRQSVKQLGPRGKRGGSKKKQKSTPRKHKMSPKDLQGLHANLASIQTPSSVPRLHPQFGTPTAGTPSANHWRIFASVYGPLSIPLLFHQRGRLEGRTKGGNAHLSSSELKALMLVFEIVVLSLRSSISELQIVKLESLILTFQTLAFTLHPTLRLSTNLHVISHLGEDIRRFGPTYGWWTFLIERINYIIKHVNQSGGSHYQASVVALRAATKAREVVSARLRVFKPTQDDTAEDREVMEELSALFDTVNHEGASDVLQQVSMRYAELERNTLNEVGTYSTGTLEYKTRGKSMDRTIGDTLLLKLRACLQSWGKSTRTYLDSNPDMTLPYLATQATFWEGVSFGGRRLDAAEWNARTFEPSVISFEATRLASCRNSLFESRRRASVFGCEDKRAFSGVLCAVFEHSMVSAEGIRLESRLYGVIRKLRAYEGEDIYGYRQHPSLGVWLWDADELLDAEVIWLTTSTTDSLRPLAITRLPKAVDGQGAASEGEVWATIPLPHH